MSRYKNYVSKKAKNDIQFRTDQVNLKNLYNNPPLPCKLKAF